MELAQVRVPLLLILLIYVFHYQNTSSLTSRNRYKLQYK
jgi:hypothetical protein